MTYLNGSPAILRSPEYMRATLDQRAVWFSLWCYCHEMTNGGKIVDCKQWTDSMWYGIQVTPSIVLCDSPLWRFSGLVLLVYFYDTEAERVFIKKTRMGREYALRRWEKQNAPKPVADGSPIASPNGSTYAKGGKEVGMDTAETPTSQPTATPPVNRHSVTKRKVRAVRFQRPVSLPHHDK